MYERVDLIYIPIDIREGLSRYDGPSQLASFASVPRLVAGDATDEETRARVREGYRAQQARQGKPVKTRVHFVKHPKRAR